MAQRYDDGVSGRLLPGELPDYRSVLDSFRKERPDLVARLAPRRYLTPSGYASPSDIAARLGITCVTGGSGLSEEDPVARTGYITVVRLLKHAVPTFFVGRELLPAIAATDPPAMSPLEVPWPFPGLVFVLPQGPLVSPTDGACDYLAVARHDAGDVVELPGLSRVLVPRPRMSVFTTTDKGVDFGAHVDLERKSVEELLGAEGDWRFSLGYGQEAPAELAPTDDAFVRRLVSLAIRLLLVMAARPDLVERGGIARPATVKHGRERSALWHPNFIGRTFHVVREESATGADRPSPRMHWRRGHWRQQAVGPRGDGEHKVIWLEPILVSAPAR